MDENTTAPLFENAKNSYITFWGKSAPNSFSYGHSLASNVETGIPHDPTVRFGVGGTATSSITGTNVVLSTGSQLNFLVNGTNGREGFQYESRTGTYSTYGYVFEPFNIHIKWELGEREAYFIEMFSFLTSN